MSSARAVAAGVLPVTSIVPPAPIAPKLLEQVKAAEAAIAEGEARIGALALAEMQGEAGATARLAELEATIAAAKADHGKKNATYKAALAADRAALEAHHEWVRALPSEILVAGVTAKKCCDLCHAEGCAIGGGLPLCMHPRLGGIPPRHQSDRVIRDHHHAANMEIRRLEELAR